MTADDEAMSIDIIAMLEKASNDIEKILKDNNITVVQLGISEFWLDHTGVYPSGDYSVRQISVKNGEQ